MISVSAYLLSYPGKGAEQVLEIPLSPDELEKLKRSATELKEVLGSVI